MKKQNMLEELCLQLFEKGNTEMIPEAFAVSYQAHAGEKTYTGRQLVLRYVKQLRAALPDLRLKQIEIISETGNTVSWKRTFTGTHRGSLRGIPASGKKVTWQELIITRFEKNLIAGEWLMSDLALQTC